MVKVGKTALPGEVATLPPILCASLDNFSYFDTPSSVVICATTTQKVDYRVLLLRKSEGPMLKYSFSEGLCSLLQVLRVVVALREGKAPKSMADGLVELEGITLRQYYPDEDGRQEAAQYFRSGRRVSSIPPQQQQNQQNSQQQQPRGGSGRSGYTDKSTRTLAWCTDAIEASAKKYPHGKARAILGFVRFLRGYYIVLVKRRKRVASIGPHVVYEVQDTSMIPLFRPDVPEGGVGSSNNDGKSTSSMGNAFSSLFGLGVKGEEDKYLNMFKTFDLRRFSYYSHTYDLTNTLQVNMLRRHRALAARKALVQAENKRAESEPLTDETAATSHTQQHPSAEVPQVVHHLGDSAPTRATSAPPPLTPDQLPRQDDDTNNNNNNNTQSNMKPPSINADVRDKFVWNDYLLQPTRVGRPRDLNSVHGIDDMEVHDGYDRWVSTMWKSWTVPIIHGCVVEAQFDSNAAGKGPIKFVLIGRSSKNFAGARYLKRGLNGEGCVANHVEVEQIVYDSASLTRFDTRGAFSSFVQVRGSVPVSWYHPPVNRPKPPIVIGHNGDQYNATRLHFEELIEDLGAPIVAVNLLKTSEKKGREVGLSLEYRRALATLSWPLRNGRWLQDLHEKYGVGGDNDEDGVPSATPHIADGLKNMTLVNQEVQRLNQRVSERPPPQLVPLFTPVNSLSNTTRSETTSPRAAGEGRNSGSYHSRSAAASPSPKSTTTAPQHQQQGKDAYKTFLVDESVLPTSLIQYVEFDLRNNSESAWNSLTALAEARIPPVGVFSCDSTGAVFSKQCGALRSNCVDCIDRTNLGQFFFGLYALSMQLQSIGMLVDSCDVVLSDEIPETVLKVFLCLGDAIAIQYGGSAQVGAGLLHRGLGWDKIMGIRRLYTNMLVDKDKQMITNLFLGLYTPSPASQRLRQACYLYNYKVHRRLMMFLCSRRDAAHASRGAPIGIAGVSGGAGSTTNTTTTIPLDDSDTSAMSDHQNYQGTSLDEETLEKECEAIRFITLPHQRKVQRNFWGQVQSEVEDSERLLDLHDLESDYYLHIVRAYSPPGQSSVERSDWWRLPLMAYHARHDPFFYLNEASLESRIQYSTNTGKSNTNRPVLSQTNALLARRSELWESGGPGGGGGGGGSFAGGGFGYRSSWLLVDTGGVQEVEDDLLDDVIEQRWTRSRNNLTVAAKRPWDRDPRLEEGLLPSSPNTLTAESPTKVEQKLAACAQDCDCSDDSDGEDGAPIVSPTSTATPSSALAPQGASPTSNNRSSAPHTPSGANATSSTQPPHSVRPRRNDGNAALFFARLVSTTIIETTVRPSRRLPLVDRVPIDRHATSGAALVVEPSFVVQKPWVHDVVTYPKEVERSRYRWEERKYRWMLFQEGNRKEIYAPLITPSARARFNTPQQADVVKYSTPSRYSHLDSCVTIASAKPGNISFSQPLSHYASELTDDQTRLFVAVIAQFGSPYGWDNDTTIRVLTRLDSELPSKLLEAAVSVNATGEYFLHVNRGVILGQLGAPFTVLIDNIRKVFRRAHQGLTNRSAFDDYLKSGTKTVDELERLLQQDAVREADFTEQAGLGPRSLLQSGKVNTGSEGMDGGQLLFNASGQDGFYEYTTTYRGVTGVPFALSGRPFEDDVASMPPFWDYPSNITQPSASSAGLITSTSHYNPNTLHSGDSTPTCANAPMHQLLGSSFDPEMAKLAGQHHVVLSSPLGLSSALARSGVMPNIHDATASQQHVHHSTKFVEQLMNTTSDRPSTISHLPATCNAFQKYFTTKLTQSTVEQVLVDFIEDISHLYKGVPLGSCIRYVERQSGVELFRNQEYTHASGGSGAGGGAGGGGASPGYNPHYETQGTASVSSSLPVPIVVPHVFTVPVWCSWLEVHSERVGLTLHRVSALNMTSRIQWCRGLTDLLVNAGVMLKCEIPHIRATGLGVTTNLPGDFEDDMMLYTFAACLSKRPLNASRMADAARAAVRTELTSPRAAAVRSPRDQPAPLLRTNVIGISSIVELSEAMVSIALGVFSQFDTEIRRIAHTIQTRSSAGGVGGGGAGGGQTSAGAAASIGSGVSGASIARQALAQVMSRNTFDVAEELRRVDISCLGLEERICFFVNVFNALYVQSWIASTVQPQLDIISFYLTAGYTIGGHFYSLADIKHGILRGNRPANFLMLPQFLMDDARKVLTVKYDKVTTPKIAFALLDTYVTHERMHEIRPYEAGTKGFGTQATMMMVGASAAAGGFFSANNVDVPKRSGTVTPDHHGAEGGGATPTSTGATSDSAGYDAAIAAAKRMMEEAARNKNNATATSSVVVPVSPPSEEEDDDPEGELDPITGKRGAVPQRAAQRTLVPGPDPSPAAFKPKSKSAAGIMSKDTVLEGNDDDDTSSSDGDNAQSHHHHTNDSPSRRTILFHQRPTDLPSDITSPTAKFVVDGPASKYSNSSKQSAAARRRGTVHPTPGHGGWGLLDIMPWHAQAPAGGNPSSSPQPNHHSSPHGGSRAQNFLQQSNSAYRAVAQWFTGSRKAAVVVHFCRPMRPESLYEDLDNIEKDFANYIVDTYSAAGRGGSGSGGIGAASPRGGESSSMYPQPDANNMTLDSPQGGGGAGVVYDVKGVSYPRELIPLAALEELGSLEDAYQRVLGVHHRATKQQQ